MTSHLNFSRSRRSVHVLKLLQCIAGFSGHKSTARFRWRPHAQAFCRSWVVAVPALGSPPLKLANRLAQFQQSLSPYRLGGPPPDRTPKQGENSPTAQHQSRNVSCSPRSPLSLLVSLALFSVQYNPSRFKSRQTSCLDWGLPSIVVPSPPLTALRITDLDKRRNRPSSSCKLKKRGPRTALKVAASACPALLQNCNALEYLCRSAAMV